MKEKYSIEIADIQLTILSDEPEEFVYATVNRLDEQVRDLTVKNKRCSKLDAALLCALDFLGEKTKCDKKIKNLEAQISLYEANIKRLRSELESVKNGAVSAPELPQENDIPSPETSQSAPAATDKKADAADEPKKTEPQKPAVETGHAAQVSDESKAPDSTLTPDPSSKPEASATTGLPSDKLSQIEALLRRRSENRSSDDPTPSDAPAEKSQNASSRSEKLREIEELLRGSSTIKSLSEALHDALGH